MSVASRVPGILVTRPVPQNQSTLDAIEAIGWHAYPFPTIELKKLDSIIPETSKPALVQSDWLVFISQAAVSCFFSDFSPADVSHLQIAAVGGATRKALHDVGVTVDACPDSATNSEALLELESLKNVNGQKIIIVRGVGGRELLQQTLTERGASVSYLEVYQRQIASPDRNIIRQHWDSGIDAVICTSNQLLDNYLQLVKPLIGDKIFSKPLLLISSRMQRHASRAGFSRIWLAEGPANDQMIKTLNTHLQLD